MTIAFANTPVANVTRPRLHRQPRSVLLPLLFPLAAVFCLTPWVTPPIALGIGAVLALLIENPFARIGHKLSKFLLQSSVILLGFGMNLPVVLRAGSQSLIFSAATIVLTLTLGFLLGRLLKLKPRAAALIAAGTAICGGSAIAAVGSAIDADQADMTVAMGAVFLLNAAALYLFPPIGHWLHLTDTQFGTWAGIAIHDVSSVVGAASRFGVGALQTATAVKLSRALWIIPVTLAMSFIAGRRLPQITNATFGFDAAAQKTPGKIQIPWFIALFLLASLSRSFIPAIASIAPTLTHGATLGLTVTLFLIGSSLSAATLRTVGVKAFAAATILWLFISTVSLLVILHV